MALPPPTGLARTNRQLLTDRVFGPWFWGNVISNAGNWLFNVVAAVVVYDLSGSAILVGLVSVSQFLPLIVLSPWAGALSDRLDRRQLLLTGQTIAAVSSFALAIPAAVLGVDQLPGTWTIVVAALGIGVGQALSKPAQNSLVPLLVDDIDLENAVSLTSLTFNIGRALGPGVAGAILLAWGAATAFVINAVSFLGLIAALAILRARRRVAEHAGDRSALAGLRHVRGDRRMVVLLLAIAATGFTADPVITLSPPLADVLGGGDALVAAMVSAFGVAAIPGTLLSGRLQRRFGGLAVGGGGMVLTAAGAAVVGLAGGPLVAVLGFAAMGTGSALAVTSFTSVLQRYVVEEFRGRVMALWAVAFLGNRPVAALLDGVAADLAGPRWAMNVALAVALLGATAAWRLHGELAPGATPLDATASSPGTAQR